MKLSLRIMMLLLFAALAAACEGGMASGKPNTAEAQTALEAFLKSGGSCRGTRTIRNLKIINIGPNEQNLGGFPVFASGEVVCQDGKMTTTWQLGNNPKAMVAVLRRGSTGGWEAFIPAFFEQAQKEMEAAIKKQLKF